jgi:enoyl-CoA hydratase/carnithine racemase
VRLEVSGPVASITLCRPERRNAQTPSTWQALAAIGDSLADDVRVVVVRGEGLSFSAGLDRRMFTPAGVPGEGSLGDVTGGDDSRAVRVIAAYQSGLSWLRRPELVSVAAVQGHAIGAGFQLALACDLRVVATDAQFTMAEPSLGLVPDLGGTQPLVDAVGYSRALEICATGRRVGAAEAERIGLATVVVAPDELAAATSDLVASLLAAPRDAVTGTKALLLGARDRGYDEQLLAERQAQVRRLRALGA